MKTIRMLVATVLCTLLPLIAQAAPALGAAGLRARYTSLGPELASSPFGSPLVLRSEDVSRRIDGDVYAVLDRPFAEVSAALGDASHWCDILILHLNTKYCRRVDDASGTRVDLRVGKKGPEAIAAAKLLSFRWRPRVQEPDYLAVQMAAADGPYDTHDYALLAEAVPLEGGRTFLHMAYGFSYGAASDLAMHIYLGTAGRDKVGFTRERPASGGDEALVGGMRGAAERNTMRYYLAIQAYLAAPGERQLQQRLATWFDSTEKYARQLHEVDRNAYLRMKQDEVRRQASAR